MRVVFPEVNYPAIYNSVYADNPSYSQRGNSPAVRFFDYAKNLAIDLWPADLSAIVDVGAGRSALRSLLPSEVEHVSIDCAANARPDFCLDITRDSPPPLNMHASTIVACFDVLEHIHTADVPAAIDFLARFNTLTIGSICLRASTTTDAVGNQLHLSVMDATWWLSMLKSRFRVIRHNVLAGSDLIFAATNC